MAIKREDVIATKLNKIQINKDTSSNAKSESKNL